MLPASFIKEIALVCEMLAQIDGKASPAEWKEAGQRLRFIAWLITPHPEEGKEP